MPKIKRESRQFIVINEEKLINEVQDRPILYDKALKGYRKPTMRENAWEEVGIALGSTVEECKKRWRSLRDAFMKQHKLFSRGDSTNKKRWLFYEHMEFLVPFFDVNDDKYMGNDEEYIETINIDEAGNINMKQSDSMNEQIVCISGDDNTYRQIEIDAYNEEQLDEDCMEDGATYERITTNSNQKHVKSGENVYILSGTAASSASSHDESPGHQSARHTKIMPRQSIPLQNDPDERFLLSCLPILKRLTNKKNALARLKIQQTLFDIEFEKECN